jgi:hypothetical protein
MEVLWVVRFDLGYDDAGIDYTVCYDPDDAEDRYTYLVNHVKHNKRFFTKHYPRAKVSIQRFTLSKTEMAETIFKH